MSRKSEQLKEQIKERVIETLQKVLYPVSIDLVRYRIGGNWSIVKCALLELVLEGKIRGMKTSKSWVFWSKEEGEKVPPVVIPKMFVEALALKVGDKVTIIYDGGESLKIVKEVEGEKVPITATISKETRP